jgi:hypothetical protein
VQVRVSWPTRTFVPAEIWMVKTAVVESEVSNGLAKDTLSSSKTLQSTCVPKRVSHECHTQQHSSGITYVQAPARCSCESCMPGHGLARTAAVCFGGRLDPCNLVGAALGREGAGGRVTHLASRKNGFVPGFHTVSIKVYVYYARERRGGLEGHNCRAGEGRTNGGNLRLGHLLLCYMSRAESTLCRTMPTSTCNQLRDWHRQ